MPVDEKEERAELARRHLQSYAALSQQMLTLVGAVPEEATAPALREALHQILELVLESTVARGRDFVSAASRAGLLGRRPAP